MVLQRVRRDALPENTHYYDDGCDVHPYCLTCPLAKCRYEYPQGLATVRSQTRVARAVELRNLGFAADEIATAMFTSRRAVFRMMATARKATGDTMSLKVKRSNGIVVSVGESNYGRA